MIAKPPPILPTLPSWVNVSTSEEVTVNRTASSTLNTQSSTQAKLSSTTADKSPISILYGDQWCGGKIDYIAQHGSNLVIRAIFCVGPVLSVDEIKINESSFATGDYTGDPDFKGDYTTWAGLQTLPVNVLVNWIFTHAGKTYRVKETFTIGAGENTSSYSPTSASYLYEQLLTNITLNTYTGTDTQGIDPILLGLFPGYDETLVIPNTPEGFCYTVLQIPLSQYSGGLPTITAKIRGKLVWNPNTLLTEYSDNPALCLADLLRSTTYGMGVSVDDVSLIEAAAYCDDLILSEPRASLNLEIDSTKLTSTWVDVLRAYAYVYIAWGETVKFIVDKANTPTHILKVLPEESVDLLASIPKRTWLSRTDRPNQVRVIYTNPNNNYNDSSVTVETAEVTNATEVVRLTEIKMPGLLSEQQALNFANRRLLAAQYEVWSTDFKLLDMGEELIPGNVVSVEVVPGLPTEDVRVIKRTRQAIGRYTITARRYKAEVYV